jgi:hypothetical protein
MSTMTIESKETYQSKRSWNPSAIELKIFGDLMILFLKSPVNWNSHDT